MPRPLYEPVHFFRPVDSSACLLELLPIVSVIRSPTTCVLNCFNWPMKLTQLVDRNSARERN
jgi:hypothetical protein